MQCPKTVGPAVKITLRVDANVVKICKAMGAGYRHKINRVLSAFVPGRLSRTVNGPDTTDFVIRPDEVLRWRAARTDGCAARARSAGMAV